jgi:superfamily II DNA or RNA helicase
MVNYRDLISRADTAWLQEQVGEMAVRVMQAFDEKGINAQNLRKVFLSLVSPYDLIADQGRRNSLVEFMRREEAAELSQTLGLHGEPYQALGSLQMNRSSEKFETCCAFFGLAPEVRVAKFESPEVETVSASYALFEHQQMAVDSVKQQLAKKPNRVVLHMPTGAGKTRMAMHVVCQHLYKSPKTVVVWLANSEELCDQAADEFLKAWSFLGNRDLNLYRYWGGRSLDFSTLEDGFFVGGFSKLYSLAKRQVTELAALGDRTSLIVVDEAHKVIAPTYEAIIEGISARKFSMPLLGLTATPGRTWNEPDADKQLAEFFQKKKVTLQVPGFKDPVEYLVQSGYLAEPEFRRLQYVSDKLTAYEIKNLAEELDVPASILKKLAGDERRSVLIIRELESMLDRHSRIIVFATTVSHAEMLTAVLSVRGHNVKCITGETPPAQRAESIGWFKGSSEDQKIIVNFGVLTTGFDAPRTSAALIARPTKSLVLYSQMVGRAIRGKKAGGNEKAEIVTVVDTALPGFGNLNLAFTNWEDVW